MCSQTKTQVKISVSHNDSECPEMHISSFQVTLRQTRVSRTLAIAIIVFGVIGCILALVGTVTPKWVVADNVISAGLIFACNPDCSAFAAEGPIAATKVFVVIAFFCTTAGVIGCILHCFKFFITDTSHKVLSRMVTILYFIAVALDAGGVAIFAAIGKADAEAALRTPVTLGYSFVVTIVAGICCWFAGILSLIHCFGQPTYIC